jgi:uncharacterized protein YbbC (DUF1343 family)
MKACGENNVKVWILDRPNPIDGKHIEGNVLNPAFDSFVGMYPIPMRHGLTAGEIAKMGIEFWQIECDVSVISMKGWERTMFFPDTGLPWVMPSPNMPNIETAMVYPGTVLFEGTQLSEGRGTTRSLEIFGHPFIDPFEMTERLENALDQAELEGIKLRPLYFKPTFHKFMEEDCGGWQMHVTDPNLMQPWKTTQIVFRELYKILGKEFNWRKPPYEYEHEKEPIDILNGTDRLRIWVEQDGSDEELLCIENEGMDDYLGQREAVLLY